MFFELEFYFGEFGEVECHLFQLIFPIVSQHFSHLPQPMAVPWAPARSVALPRRLNPDVCSDPKKNGVVTTGTI